MKSLISFLFLFALAILSGCSGGGNHPPLGTVTGTVTFKGSPAADVIVAFNPTAGGRGSTGITDANGNYTLVFSTSSMGAMVGKHNVVISSNIQPRDDMMDLKKAPNAIPSEFAKITKEVEVTSGRNTIDLAYP